MNSLPKLNQKLYCDLSLATQIARLALLVNTSWRSRDQSPAWSGVGLSVPSTFYWGTFKKGTHKFPQKSYVISALWSISWWRNLISQTCRSNSEPIVMALLMPRSYQTLNKVLLNSLVHILPHFDRSWLFKNSTRML